MLSRQLVVWTWMELLQTILVHLFFIFIITVERVKCDYRTEHSTFRQEIIGKTEWKWHTKRQKEEWRKGQVRTSNGNIRGTRVKGHGSSLHRKEMGENQLQYDKEWEGGGQCKVKRGKNRKMQVKRHQRVADKGWGGGWQQLYREWISRTKGGNDGEGKSSMFYPRMVLKSLTSSPMRSHILLLHTYRFNW